MVAPHSMSPTCAPDSLWASSLAALTLVHLVHMRRARLVVTLHQPLMRDDSITATATALARSAQRRQVVLVTRTTSMDRRLVLQFPQVLLVVRHHHLETGQVTRTTVTPAHQALATRTPSPARATLPVLVPPPQATWRTMES